VARAVERAVVASVPEVDRVNSHVEPLDPARPGAEVADDAATQRAVQDLIERECGRPPHAVRLVRTPDGVVAYVTLSLGPATLADAHDIGGRVRRAIRDGVLGVTDAFVQARP